MLVTAFRAFPSLSAACALVWLSLAATGVSAQEILADTRPGGATTFVSINPFVGINDKGEVAFVADQGMGTALWVADAAGSVTNLAMPLANLTYAAAAIGGASGSTSSVVSRELRPGSPPAYTVRKHGFPSGPSAIIETSNSNPAVDSVSFHCDVNNNGVAVVATLTNGSTSTQLRAGPAQPTVVLATYNTTIGLRPEISDDDRVVIKDNLNRIVVFPYPGPGVEVVASTASGYPSVGDYPGISHDGEVAFVSSQSSIPGVFVAIQFAGGREVVQVAGGGLDDFTSIHTFQRTGCLSRGSLAEGKDVVAVFTGVRSGVVGLFAAGVRVRDVGGVLEQSPIGVFAIAKAGDSIGDRQYVGFSLHHPVNRHGAVAFHASLVDGGGATSNAVVRIKACASPSLMSQPGPPGQNLKFKQIDAPSLGFDWGGSCLLDPGSSTTCAGFGGAFEDFGCTLTSISTAFSIAATSHGLPLTSDLYPVPTARRLQTQGHLITQGGCTGCVVDPGNIAYRRLYSNAYLSIFTERSVGGFDFDRVIEELRQGHPVMLAVPSGSRSQVADDLLVKGKLHYILAYGFDEGRAKLYGEPAGILVNDPGYGPGTYAWPATGNPTPGNVMGFNATNWDRDVHVTLHDYFAAASVRNGANQPAGMRLLPDYLGCWGTDPSADARRVRRWFDAGEVYRQGQPAPSNLPAGTMRKLVTLFDTTVSPIVITPTNPFPSVMAASPVELAFTSATTGTRYVSSVAIQGSGNVLLERFPSDLIEPADIVDPRVFDPAFLPFTLALPPPLFGIDLDLEIIGTGTGSYHVQYTDTIGSPVLQRSFSGFATPGSTSLGSFDVSSSIGQIYCSPGAPNSAGSAGVIHAYGSAAAADNDISLVASQLPEGGFGFFLTSQDQGFVMNPGGSQGHLCLGNSIGRYVGPGQILNSGPSGQFELRLDLSATPTPFGLIQALPGETWNFQCWHRDFVGGASTSNLTDAVSVVLQ